MPIKDGKWEDVPCYMNTMGQTKCGGHMVLKDVRLVPERVSIEEGHAVVQVREAYIEKVYVCDACGAIFAPSSRITHRRRWDGAQQHFFNFEQR